MNNILKLSQQSRGLLEELKQTHEDCVKTALAIVVASRRNLPSQKPETFVDYFNDNVKGKAKEDVFFFNELFYINVDEVVELVQKYWLARMYTLYPNNRVVYSPSGFFLFNINNALSEGELTHSQAHAKTIVRLINGFTLMFEEIESDTPVEQGE